MNIVKKKSAYWYYAAALIVGFAGLCVPRIFDLEWGNGLATFLWIFAFLDLTFWFRRKRELILTGLVFCIGCYLKFSGATGEFWLNLVLFLLVGLVLYGIFLLYSSIIRKWDKFFLTLTFPMIWTAVYLIATVARFPSPFRIDMMFVDMNILIQAESLVGSIGFAFLILWMESLVQYSVRNKRMTGYMVGAGIILAILMVGVIHLYPNGEYTKTVRVAYTTGPYVGTFLDYSVPSVKDDMEDMEKSAEKASAQKADILVFNEETYQIDDAEENNFLKKCSQAARENKIHMLVGLDITDTDHSEKGQSLNKIVWIDSNGNIQGSYVKTKTIPVIESDYKRGEGEIPSLTIEVAGESVKVSYLICYDSNFPQYIRQMDDNTDILFLPSWDWSAVTQLHSKLCRTIAVENRVSVLKPTYDGLSLAVDPDGNVLHTSDTSISGFGNMQIVNTPIKGGDSYVSNVPEKKPFAYAIIAAEIMSILICLVLLYGNQVENPKKTKRRKLYSIMTATCIFGLLSDAISYVIDGCTGLLSLSYLTTLLSTCMTFVLIAEFVQYLAAHLEEINKNIKVNPHVFLVLFEVLIAITLVGCITGQIFTFRQGVYEDGPMYGFYIIINIVSMAAGYAIIVIYRKSLGLHASIASYLYMTIPAICAVINGFVEEWSFAYPATTLSLVVLYVMIQSEQTNKLEMEGLVSSHHATHDELTGLYNRRAYTDKFQKLLAMDQKIGVIFSDVNGLKYVNDSYGHQKGDELLKQYAYLIRRIFRKEEIYRISGDEFVILLSNVTEKPFTQRVEKFKTELLANDYPLACYGVAYGNSSELNELIKKAEGDMYLEKDAFYQEHPEMKR